MQRPLEAGDICEVIDSPAGKKSPNIGLRVEVRTRVYGPVGNDHRHYGPMYHCTGSGVKQLTDGGGYVETGWADFAGAWLRRIDESLPAEKTTTHEGIAA